MALIIGGEGELIAGLQSRYLDESELREAGIAHVGENVRVSEHATLVGVENMHFGSNIRIDSHVVILSRRGRLEIGNNVHLEPASSIVTHNGVSIGNYCTVSHGVRLFTASADYSGEWLTNVFPDERFQKPKVGSITLGDHVIVGANSVVMPGVTIGEGAAIGALSFIRHSIEGWRIYGGNPLKDLGPRSTGVRDLADRIEATPNEERMG
jgi:acetyltransferase-like isoleucine patch superfamily enzyme